MHLDRPKEVDRVRQQDRVIRIQAVFRRSGKGTSGKALPTSPDVEAEPPRRAASNYSVQLVPPKAKPNFR